MSQRRSSSSASFASSSSSSSSSFSFSSPNSSSANPSPSSSPTRVDHQHSIDICPFGRSPLASSSSSSTTVDHLPSSIPSSSQQSSSTNVLAKSKPSTSVVSICCPLIRHCSKNASSSSSSPSSSFTSSLSTSLVQLFSSSPTPTTTRENRDNRKNGRQPTSDFVGCSCSSASSSTAELPTGEFSSPSLPSSTTQRRRRRRHAECTANRGQQQTDESNKWWKGGDGKMREALLVLLLQFFWIVPYLCFANYLERCLLPLRLYCYTDPDLLAVHRSLRPSSEACAAHLFVSPSDSDNQRKIPNAFCPLNLTLSVLQHPWRIKLDDSALKRVIVIRSAPRALDYRQFIRSSWKSSVERLNGPVIFVTGHDGTEMASESGEHGDILQLDFTDSYRNLTLKMMGIYRYFTERSRVQQIVVINDDTIVNATAFGVLFREIEEKQLHSTVAGGRYLIGKVSRAYPRLVFPWLPWYVPAELYPHKCYPPFVQGSSFVISREAAAEVLRRVCDFPWHQIHLDDILMGIVTNCLGISNIHRDGFDIGHSLERFTVFHYQFSRHSADVLMGMFQGVRYLL